MKRLRLVLADDHAIVLSGIRALLERVGGYEIVAEAANGDEAIALAIAYRPDVTVMDIAMPGIDGVEATRRIRKEIPDARVIILSMHDSKNIVEHALRAGAAGYLLKGSTTQELMDAIAAVMQGTPYLSPAISSTILDLVTGTHKEIPGDTLTRRHREILRLVALGDTNKRIAEALDISEKTVESHRAELMRRLGARNTADLVRDAMRLGLIDPPL